MTPSTHLVAGIFLAIHLTLSAAAAQQSVPSSSPGNPQQPEPLPSEPMSPAAGEELELLPGEVTVFQTEEAKPPEPPRYKLQLAEDAMRPILPPLNDMLSNAEMQAVQQRVFVKKFVFEGNRVFSDQQLAKVVAPYTGREITPEEAEAARVALTRHYVDAGYVNSGAVLPDQDLESGVIRVQIVEGRITDIDLSGNRWFRSWWLKSRLRRAAGTPANINRLRTGLQFLRQNPNVSRINAELKPGVRPGESILHVAVKDAQPFRLGFEVSNKRPPSVGEGVGELYFADLNLTGHDDALEARWGAARWTKDGGVEYAEFDNIQGDYAFPLTPWGTTAQISGGKSDSSIIDETFAELGIRSRSTQFTATVRQLLFEGQKTREIIRPPGRDGAPSPALYRTHSDTVSLALSADRRHSETFLLNRPFTLSPGAVDGESDVFALRLALEWVNRSQAHVFTVRSTFSWGLDAFGSTVADSRKAEAAGATLSEETPDSVFLTWLGQAQYVRRLFEAGLPAPPEAGERPRTLTQHLRQAGGETLLLLRANGQLANEPLLSLEQFSIGGAQSVRGYRENQLLRDNGIFASAELRIPLWLSSEKTPIVSLAPFFDWGMGWNDGGPNRQSKAIYSAGIGLLVNVSRYAQLSAYWGRPFVDLHNPKNSLQDLGLHFALSVNAF